MNRSLKRKRQKQNQRNRLALKAAAAKSGGDGNTSDSKDDAKRPRMSGDDDSDKSDNYVVKITDKGSFSGKFNEIRGSILRTAILAAVDNAIKWRMFVPRFTSAKFNRGLYQVRCADMTSLFWLRKAISELPPLWRGCNLDVLVREETLRKHRVSTYIPGPPEPVNIVMPRIQAQNANLNSERWDILDRKLDGQRGQTLIFGLDDEVIELLKKINFKVYCGVHCIQFRIIDDEFNTSTPQQANESKTNVNSSDEVKVAAKPGTARKRFRGKRFGQRRSLPNSSNAVGDTTTNGNNNTSTAENGSATKNNDSQVENSSTPQPQPQQPQQAQNAE